MEYTTTVNGSEMTIALRGRLDTETSPRFEQEVVPALADISSIGFDFEGLEYISSSGLRVLLALKKMMMAKGGDVSVVNVSEGVLSIFKISGFDIILNVR